MRCSKHAEVHHMYVVHVFKYVACDGQDVLACCQEPLCKCSNFICVARILQSMVLGTDLSTLGVLSSRGGKLQKCGKQAWKTQLHLNVYKHALYIHV